MRMPAETRKSTWPHGLRLPAADRHEHFVTLVQQQIAELLRFDSARACESEIAADRFRLDSLMAIELRNRWPNCFNCKNP